MHILFFTELLNIIQLKLFADGYPVLSTISITSEDFKLCGQIMGMSVIQGGPAPCFLAPEIASYILGKPLLVEKNKTPQLKQAAQSVSTPCTIGYLVYVFF